MTDLNDRLRDLADFEVGERTPTRHLRDRVRARKRRQIARTGIATSAIIGVAVVTLMGNDGRDHLATTDGEDRAGSSSCAGGHLIAATMDGRADGWTPEVVVVRPGGHLDPVTPGWLSVQPTFSPSGDRMALVRAVEGNYESAGPEHTELWTVSTDGGSAERLTTGPGDDDPTWAPRGDQIAFIRAEGPSSALMVVPDTGGDPAVVYEPNPGTWLAAPAWSPNATQLAFVLGEPVDNEDRISVAVIDLDGGDPRLLAEIPRAVSVDWHPDGGSLLVTGEGVAFTVDAVSGQRTEIGGDVQAARWTMGGNGIVFTQLDGRLLRGTITDGRILAKQELGIVSAGYVYSDIDVGHCE